MNAQGFALKNLMWEDKSLQLKINVEEITNGIYFLKFKEKEKTVSHLKFSVAR